MRVNADVSYDELYPEKIKGYFGEDWGQISTIVLSKESFKIDVDQIIENLGITVENTYFTAHSGQYDSENKKMSINILESSKRQRFTKSHELGHFVFRHEGISNRLQEPKVNNAKERAANQFAAELLMPKTLLTKAIDQMSNDYLMTWDELDKLDDDIIISYLSDKLDVSKDAMKYRLINLGVLST